MQKVWGLETPRLAPLLNQWLALLRHERDVLHATSARPLRFGRPPSGVYSILPCRTDEICNKSAKIRRSRSVHRGGGAATATLRCRTRRASLPAPRLPPYEASAEELG